MEERYQLGQYATSKAGHDKNHLYIIVRVEAEYVWLANGTTKPAERPKKKNKRHVQIIRKIDAALHEKLMRQEAIENAYIIKALEAYGAMGQG